MSQAWSHVFLNLRHNSFQTKGRLVRIVDQNGGKFEEIWKKMHFTDPNRNSSVGDL